MGDRHFGHFDFHLFSHHIPEQAVEKPAREGAFDPSEGYRFFIVVESVLFGAKKSSLFGSNRRSKRLVTLRKTRVKDTTVLSWLTVKPSPDCPLTLLISL